MIAIDTDEKFQWFIKVLENDELQLVSRVLTEEDKEELSREIAAYKVAHLKTPAAEAVLA